MTGPRDAAGSRKGYNRAPSLCAKRGSVMKGAMCEWWKWGGAGGPSDVGLAGEGTHIDLSDGNVHNTAHHNEGVKCVPGVTEIVLGRDVHMHVRGGFACTCASQSLHMCVQIIYIYFYHKKMEKMCKPDPPPHALPPSHDLI